MGMLKQEKGLLRNEALVEDRVMSIFRQKSNVEFSFSPASPLTGKKRSLLPRVSSQSSTPLLMCANHVAPENVAEMTDMETLPDAVLGEEEDAAFEMIDPDDP